MHLFLLKLKLKRLPEEIFQIIKISFWILKNKCIFYSYKAYGKHEYLCNSFFCIP